MFHPKFDIKKLHKLKKRLEDAQSPYTVIPRRYRTKIYLSLKREHLFCKCGFQSRSVSKDLDTCLPRDDHRPKYLSENEHGFTVPHSVVDMFHDLVMGRHNAPPDTRSLLD